MSQAGEINIGGGGAVVETLTGNDGIHVPATSNNINVVGNNTQGINITGNAGTSTLTVTGINASSSQIGVMALASSAEAIAGTEATKAITSATLAAKLGTGTEGAGYQAVFGQSSTSALTWATALTNGQLLIGSVGALPSSATLTQGANISITNGAGSITIAANTGSQVANYTGVNHAASSYTVLATDYYISCDVTGGVITLLFPNAPTTGRIFVVKDKVGLSATSNITIKTVGGAVNIDGATSYVIAINYGAVNLVFNGSSYEIY